jgi:LPS-assembly protein
MQYFSFIGQARFDKDNLDLQRTDLSASANYGPANGGIIYANLDAQPGLGITTQREEIQAHGNLQLAKYWSVFGNARYDITNSQQISDSLGLRYSDDCFALTVTYQETFIRDRDIQPNETVMVRLEFKYLGAVDVNPL